jgi:multiple sugar transport system substrate-binding protein
MGDIEGKPGPAATAPITRREVLKRGLIGAAGLTLLPTVIAACNSAPPSPTTVPTPATAPTPVPTQLATMTPTPASFLARKLSGQLKIGNARSNPSDLMGIEAVNAAFTATTGLTPTMRTIDHGTFAGDPVTEYLTYDPDNMLGEAFPWFSGIRMRYFADKHLVLPIDDVWANVSSNFALAFTRTVTGNDGHVYGIPVDQYPWCMFYRPSLWAEKGYTVPSTWQELLALGGQMQKDGLTPIAFGDKDGWPAMGTFDILDLRINGYDFHMDLLTGKEKWTDPKVTTVFRAWRALVPFYSDGFAGLTWQQACDALVLKTAGMHFLGLFITDEFRLVEGASRANPSDPVVPASVNDLDFFPFPFFGNTFDAEKALDAPVDIWMMPAKSPAVGADIDNAKAYLEYWAKGSTQLLMYQANGGYVPTASDVDATKLDVLTQKAVSIVSQAQRITQFMDRDTRSDFAGANAMQSFLLNFLKNPSQDLAALQKTMQDFWDVLPSMS